MKILVIAPHPDDEILGAGGMMIENVKKHNEVYVCIVTRGYPPMFKEERVVRDAQDALDCHASIGVKKTFFLDLPASKLETVDRGTMNQKILDVIQEIHPDEVFIPHAGDMQKDHQIVSEACMVCVRPKYFPQVKRVYAYETMSETGWNIPNTQNEFIPNVYVDITDSLEDKKKALSYYSLQISQFPDARSLEAIDALAKFRGATMNMRAAEAFMLIRELR